MSDQSQVYKAVFYTDGGCKPARGVGGWGVHGYIYTDTEPKTGSGCKGHYPSPFGYIPNEVKKEDSAPKEVTVVSYIDACGSLIPQSTNNAAEVTALYKAFNFGATYGTQAIHFKVDSTYALDGVREHVARWEEQGWARGGGEEIANLELWKSISSCLKLCAESNIELTYQKVKSHSGNLGNDEADRLASKGIIIGQKGISIEIINDRPGKGYWSQTAEPSRFISHPRWFFINHQQDSNQSKDGRYTYYFGDLGKKNDDDLLGKRSSDAAFSIVYLKEPEPVLEAIRKYQSTIPTHLLNGIIVGRLDTIFKPDVYYDIAKDGAVFLQTIGAKANLYTGDEDLVTTELNPPGLAFRAFETYHCLQRVLDDYLDNPEAHGLVVTDITSHLYERIVTKNKTTLKLKSEIDGSLKSLDIPVRFNVGKGIQTVPVTLTMGQDIAKRNALAALASEQTSLVVVTWNESPFAFRYATILADKDEVGIWAGVYSNLKTIGF